MAGTADSSAVVLWPEGAPGAVGDEQEDVPLLHAYLPPDERATGAGVVVAPGGAYKVLAMGHEGRDIATYLNDLVIAAFVLQYRLGPRYGYPAQPRHAADVSRSYDG